MSYFNIAGYSIAPGSQQILSIPIGDLLDGTHLFIQAKIIHGMQPGPTCFITGGIHGDELIGPEIIRRLLTNQHLNNISGTLLLIPVVNPFGYNTNSRYLPDRRDLNRCFPGTKNGSLASMMAYTLVKELLSKCQFGIDLHSAAIHRYNYPQVRLDIADKKSLDLAHAFNPPIIVHSPLRANTLRQRMSELNIPMLLFEASEALRSDSYSINTGVQGILKVLNEINIIDLSTDHLVLQHEPKLASNSHWLRAPSSGSLEVYIQPGQMINENQLLGIISDPFAEKITEIRSWSDGMIIGNITIPLVTKGDALFHIATFGEAQKQTIENMVFDYEVDIENEVL